MSAVLRQAGPMRSLQEQLTSRRIGGAVSVLMHVVLIALLLSHFQLLSRGSPLPARPQAMQISISAAPPSAANTAVPAATVPPIPPKPIEPPLQTRVPVPVPKPAPVRPPPSKPLPASPPATAAAAVPKPLGETAKSPRTAAPPPTETPEQSLLGSIHDNWLEPAVFPRGVRCHIRIDYLAGGRISNVVFVDRCGDGELVESMRKAIWKTQPLPLPASKTAAGNIMIEFTP